VNKNIVLFLVAYLLSSASLLSAELTPETFTQADIEAREVTNLGMADRLELLSSGTVTIQEENQLNSSTEQMVQAVFDKYGTTQSDHLVYSEKNATVIAEFLEENPDYQTIYDSLNAQFSDILNSIDAILAR